jgi:hypothetical protein
MIEITVSKQKVLQSYFQRIETSRFCTDNGFSPIYKFQQIKS